MATAPAPLDIVASGQSDDSSHSTQVPAKGATVKSQANALYRKNAVFQRRNWCSNCCLLSAPIFFCLLLFGIQIAINKLLLSGDDYAVSLQCLHSMLLHLTHCLFVVCLGALYCQAPATMLVTVHGA